MVARNSCIFRASSIRIYHEYGHALAAAREHVSIHGAGIFLTYIFPGAFVSISTIELANCDLLPRMRILCAGIWHNLVLCVLTACAVFVTPVFLKLGYYEGVCVTRVPDVLQGGLVAGDRILQINQCRPPVPTSAFSAGNNPAGHLFRCLREEDSYLMKLGYCIDNKNITVSSVNLQYPNGAQHQISSPVLSCDICTRDSRKLCYREHPEHQVEPNNFKYCLNVRESLAGDKCSKVKACQASDKRCMQIHPFSTMIASEDSDAPLIDSQAKILQIVVSRDPANSQPDISNKYTTDNLSREYPSVLYFGLLEEFLNDLEVSEFCPRGSVWPKFLPDLTLTMLKYMFAISGGLMILNALPCYALDGYLITESLLESMHGIPERVRKAILSFVTTTTTFLVALNILLSIINYSSLI